jgi:putative oxidoreductase
MDTIYSTKKWLNLSIWVVQVIMGLLFFFSGLVKASQPIPDLAEAVIWPGDVPGWLVRVIGACEVAGGVGLILPSALKNYFFSFRVTNGDDSSCCFSPR